MKPIPFREVDNRAADAVRAGEMEAEITALRQEVKRLRGREDCDGCDNAEGLKVKRVEYADGSEDWLCSDCRADRA